MLIKTTAVALAWLGMVSFVQAEPAAPMQESRTVDYPELNISSKAGAQILLRRITSAASEICGRESQRSSLDRAALQRACVKSTVDQSVAKLNSPLVTALNAQKPESVSTTLLASRR